MNTNSKKTTSSISFVEAVDLLTAVLELNPEDDLQEFHPTLLETEKEISFKTSHWTDLCKNNPNDAANEISGIFKVILHHLKKHYGNLNHASKEKKGVEGIKNVIVLVGEAAKKLDRLTSLYHESAKSMTELKEYRQLQEFYLSRIARKIGENNLSSWLSGLSRYAWKSSDAVDAENLIAKEIKHTYVDMEGVKSDNEYELLFLRKDDGSFFYSPKLIRNIKLACSFDSLITQKAPISIDPLQDLDLWKDKIHYNSAKIILNSLGNLIDRFYRDAAHQKALDLTHFVNNALLALMLCKNPLHQLRFKPFKSSSEYFEDFTYFLRKALESPEYKRCITYSGAHPNPTNKLFVDIIHSLCFSLFTKIPIFADIEAPILHLFNQGDELEFSDHKEDSVWLPLAATYKTIAKLISHHTYFPLLKALKTLESEDSILFSPIRQDNLPSTCYSLHTEDYSSTCLHLPSPTTQEFIYEATIIDEFRAYIHGLCEQKDFKGMLILSLQDRTSWREHSRCVALEDLNNLEGAEGKLHVCTIPKDTEFYHQSAPYDRENHAAIFIKSFIQQLEDESTGFYFPEKIKQTLLSEFVPQALSLIHKIFFSSKNVITKEQRLDFIEIFYTLLQLKLIDITHPDSFAFVCKDGVDVSPPASAQLCAFLKIISGGKLAGHDLDFLKVRLFAPAFTQRGRALHAQRFTRVINMLRCMESTRNQLGGDAFALLFRSVFGHHFSHPFFDAKIWFPRH